MRGDMGPKKIALIEVAIIVIVIAGGVLAYWSMTKTDDRVEQTYTYTMMPVELTGALLADDGGEVIRISQWTGTDGNLYTAWSSQGQVDVEMPESASWSHITIRIHAEPGATVKLDQVKLTTEPGVIIITEPGEVNPSSYWTSAYVMVNGAKLHSSLCSSSVTTDSSGYAEMILVVLTDQWHRHVVIDGDWTYTSST